MTKNINIKLKKEYCYSFYMLWKHYIEISWRISVQFRLSVMSDSLGTHRLQHTRPPYPSPTSGAYSNSHSPPTFNLSQHQGLFQRVGSLHQVAEALELQLQNQFINEYLELICLISLQSKGLSRVFSSTTIQKHQFFSALTYSSPRLEPVCCPMSSSNCCFLTCVFRFLRR